MALIMLREVEMTRPIRRRRDAEPQEGVEKYGDTVFAGSTNKKYPIDTPGRIRAAWAYIHQPRNAAKYTASERRTIMGRIRKAAKARRLSLPDPEEFMELMARVRRKKTEQAERTEKAAKVKRSLPGTTR